MATKNAIFDITGFTAGVAPWLSVRLRMITIIWAVSAIYQQRKIPLFGGFKEPLA
jgi:hypothetical protein